MPTKPTQGEVDTMMVNASAVFRSIYEFGNSASPNYRAKENTLFLSMVGDFGGSIYGPASLSGQDLSRAILRGRESALGVALAYAQVLGIPEENPYAAWPFVFEDWVANSYDIDSKQKAFGAVTGSGSPVGTGTIHRLTKDKDGFDIEASTEEVKTIEVDQDRWTGATMNAERFTIKGEAAEFGATLLDGSGIIGNLVAMSSDTSKAYLINPSFDDDAVSASLTQINGWTPVSSLTNYETVADPYVIENGLDSTNSRALKQAGADNLKQVIRTTLIAGQPYIAKVRYKPANSADGNVIIRCGSNSKTVAVSGTTYQELVLDLDENLWFDNFREDTLDVEIEWTGTTGDITWDGFVFGPMQPADGTWWAPIGGATRWARRDKYTATDTAAATAIIQWFLGLAGLYLPHISNGTETVPDPTL